MARARNIKPSFFTSEQLADSCPLGRLLFIGLWTLADYKGELEWKERTIKIQILPWDECDVKKLAINLDKSGLIRFYSDGDKTYINIPNFMKHQNPHKNEREKGSDIPNYSDAMRQVIDFNGIVINRDKSRAELELSHSDRADSLLLNPESPILNPDSVIQQSQQVAQVTPQAASPKNKFSDDDKKCAEWLAASLKEFIPDCKQPNLNGWAEHVRKMREIDNRNHKEICQLWLWCRKDSFEAANVQSPEKLRSRYDSLKAKMNKPIGAANGQPRDSLIDRFIKNNYGQSTGSDQGFMGSDDSVIRGEVVEPIRGDSRFNGAMEANLIGDFKASDSGCFE